jgi:hypothetical protein
MTPPPSLAWFPSVNPLLTTMTSTKLLVYFRQLVKSLEFGGVGLRGRGAASIVG